MFCTNGRVISALIGNPNHEIVVHTRASGTLKVRREPAGIKLSDIPFVSIDLPADNPAPFPVLLLEAGLLLLFYLVI